MNQKRKLIISDTAVMSSNAASGSSNGYSKSNSSKPEKKKSGGYQKNKSGKKYFGKSSNSNKFNNNKIKRKGECEDLGDNVYYIGDARQADNYTKVTKNILKYIQRMYTYGFDIKEALDNKEDFDFDRVKPKASRAGIAAASTPTAGTTTKKKDQRLVRQQKH